MDTEPRSIEAARGFVGRAFRKYWPAGVLGAKAGYHMGTVVDVRAQIQLDGKDMRGIFFDCR